MENKITKEDYLKALDIVESYHKQLNKKIKKIRFNKISDLQENDFVKCISVNWNTQKCLTEGKEYEIKRFCNDKYYFFIKDDNGKEKRYVADGGNGGKTFKPVNPNYA